MLVIKIDRIDAETLEARVARGADIFGTAVDFTASRIGRRPHDSELGRDYEFIAPAADYLADQFLVAMRPVRVRGVEEGDAQLERALYSVG